VPCSCTERHCRARRSGCDCYAGPDARRAAYEADIGFRPASRGEERFMAVEEFPSHAAPAASRKALQPGLLVAGALYLGPAR